MTIKVLRFLFLSFCFAAFAAPIAAQPPANVNNETAMILYERWKSNYRGTPEQQKIAYEFSKEILSKYDGYEEAWVKYIRNWKAKYEKAVVEYNFRQSIGQKKYADAFRSGKEILKNEPERLDVVLGLSFAGMQLAVDDPKSAFNADAEMYSVKALEMIKAGKEPFILDNVGIPVVNWYPYANKETAIGGLSYEAGYFKLKAKKPREAVPYLHAAASGRTKYAKEPTTYLYLASAYQTGDYDSLFKDFGAVMAKPVSEAQVADAQKKMDKLIPYADVMIDAYARFLALSLGSPVDNAMVDAKHNLTQFYRFRHNDSEAGLPEYILNVLSKPIPAPPSNQ